MEVKNSSYFNKEQETPIDKIPVSETMADQDKYRDLLFKQRKDMLSRSLSLVFRSTFLVRDFGKLESMSGPESLFDPAYSGNHIVILECQLKTPSQMNLIDANEADFFKMHKLSMANWRIVDVDHFMRGNSFFSKHLSELEWHNDVETRIGTTEKREVVVKEIESTKNVLEMGDIYRTYLNIKEPRSNRGLETFKSKEEIESEKKAAQEKA